MSAGIQLAVACNGNDGRLNKLCIKGTHALFSTEYGVACLFGKNLRQLAKTLINIAHPYDREMPEKSSLERFKQF